MYILQNLGVKVNRKSMNYSTEKDDYLMTTPYTKKIQQKFEQVKSFLEQNGFNPSSESLMQDIVSSEEYIAKNGL